MESNPTEAECAVSLQSLSPPDPFFVMELGRKEEYGYDEEDDEEEEGEEEEVLDEEEEDVDLGFLMWRDRGRREEEVATAEEERVERRWPRRSGGVMLEGYVEAADGDDGGSDGVARTKSLTDEDLEELKGCLDLGFGFSYEEIPELCNTLPALELCYSMSQRFLDEQQQQNQQMRSPDRSSSFRSSSSGESLDHCSSPASAPPIANWKISSPGDDPDEVKARLRYWAQAVACTVRLCS